MREKPPSRDEVRAEMLLDLAGYWRICAAQSGDPWRCDMMRATAEEFERAAAKARGPSQERKDVHAQFVQAGSTRRPETDKF